MDSFGLAGLTKIPGAVYNVEQDGFATYDKSYSGILTDPIPFRQGDIPDEYDNVVLMSLKVTETGDNCGHIKVDLHYEGKDITSTITGIATNVTIDFTTSQEPVESHPDFVTSIGGTPDTSGGNPGPKHGANFDLRTKEFIGFPVVDPSEPLALPSRFAGVRSYLMPQETFTSNTVEYDYPSAEDIATVGQAFDPLVLGISLPAIPGTRSWLLSGIRVTNIANVYYRTQRMGMLSGPRNWIPEIYGSAF